MLLRLEESTLLLLLLLLVARTVCSIMVRQGQTVDGGCGMRGCMLDGWCCRIRKVIEAFDIISSFVGSLLLWG